MTRNSVLARQLPNHYLVPWTRLWDIAFHLSETHIFLEPRTLKSKDGTGSYTCHVPLSTANCRAWHG